MNCCARLAFCIQALLLLSSCADLVVTSIGDRPFVASQLMMTATIKNEGSRDAPSSTTTVEVKTPTSSSFTQVATKATPAVNRGQQIVLDVWPFHPAALVPPGACFEARVCADTTDAVFEGWLGEDNCRIKSFCN